jgi:predicted transcriptional regulator
MTVGSNELLAHLVGVQGDETPAPMDLLELLHETPQGASDLAEDRPISRKGVYNALDPLADQYIVVQEDGIYEVTGYGVVLYTTLESALDTPGLDRSALRFLLASSNRAALLEELRATPARKATLTEGESAPSRTTVHRAIEAFDDRGWVTGTSAGQYTLTDTGDRVLAAYTGLISNVEAAQSTSEFLSCCDDTVADIPLSALADAELHVDTPDAPDTSRGLLRELADPDLDSFRGFLSTVSTASADVGDSIIRSGADTELIIPEPVLYDLPTEGHYTTHVKRGLEAQNFELLVVPTIDSLPIGLAIFDGDAVLMGPADLDHIPDGGNAGTIVSTDEELVEWATDLYTDYRTRAQSPARHVLERLKQKLSESVSVITPSDSRGG